MKTLYLDLFSGISGDMFLGALIDAGADFLRIESELARLDIGGYHLSVSRQSRSGIEGAKFEVNIEEADPPHDHGAEVAHAHAHGHGHHHDHDHGHHHPHHAHEPSVHEHPSHDPDHGRTFQGIRDLIASSELSDWVKQRSIAVFQRMAVAEGKIHGRPPDQVHFHEVGAIDSIVDIVGGCIALDLLGRPRVAASNVVEGTGWVQCAHGRFPVPTPATLEILGARGITVTQCDEPHELVTPTGAAFLAEFAEDFGPMRELRPEKIGYGIGTRKNKTRPNVLRVVLGESVAPAEASPASVEDRSHDWEQDTVVMLQTNLDDINAEVLGRFIEQVLAAGALDAFYTSVQMKKSRPGTLLSVLCAPGDADRFTEMILRETTAFGVRRIPAERRKLRREIRKVQTPLGEVEVKLGWLDGTVVQMAPEFDSCRRLADQTGVPLKQIYEVAIKAGRF
jgi:hypothetical protein